MQQRKVATRRVETAQAFIVRMNIERYEKLLKTPLTDRERAFIQRRLDEEKTALWQIAGMDGLQTSRFDPRNGTNGSSSF